MSQLAHPITTYRVHRTVVLAALLALAATAAVVLVLVLAIDGSSNDASSTPVTPSTQPGVRYDGGPEEGSRLAQPAPARREVGAGVRAAR